MVEPPSSRPCNICGDAGFEECLCSCSECHDSIHVYCMRISLKKVPEMWICEDCQSRNSDNIPNADKRQKVKVSKVKFITADEAIKLTSGATKEAPCVRTYTVGRSHLPSITASKKISVDSGTVGPKSSSFKRPPDPSSRSHERLSPHVHFNVPVASPLREFKETRTFKGHQKQNVMTEHPIRCPNLAGGSGKNSIRKAGDAMCMPSFASSPSQFYPTVPTKSKFSNEELVKSRKSGTEHRSSKNEGEVVIKKECCISSPLTTCVPTDLPETISVIGPTTGKFSNKGSAKALKSATEHKSSHNEMEIKKEPISSSPVRACKPTNLPEAISDVSSTKSKLSGKDQVKALEISPEDKTSNRKVQMVIKRKPCTYSPKTPCLPTDLQETNSGAVPIKSKFRRADQLETPKSANGHRTHSREVETIIEKVSSTISSPHLPTPTELPGEDAEGGNSRSLEKTLHNNLSLSSTSRLRAVDATWKGSFRVLHSATLGRLYEGYQAHLPLIFHHKVYEFSKKMPAILQCNFLPTSCVWVELFQDDPPDENDVGLYIFPSDAERSQTEFSSLLEAMDMDDLLMRINIDGVELLIFTSKRLHLKSENANGGNFLWGLFRPMKDTNPSGNNDLPPGFIGKRWLKERCELNHHS